MTATDTTTLREAQDESDAAFDRYFVLAVTGEEGEITPAELAWHAAQRRLHDAACAFTRQHGYTPAFIGARRTT